ncbi:helix-turn-helix transcriptional regulator [Kitasatospora sp. NBC_01287]|uniref:winged helix-turn-helix transcriptional regulator n=1 Tax=Kitasatospora sp. NBC_01287 TaxID=2903573 RepID=UPI00225B1D51|nr:helix-turn-helix domain-containing protein [Kitasatospora sp. NBC_01287]MCX4748393.1 helix-turn-helix transcriptional regulator [Kitasatospora sp. NBC_01287]
MPTPPVRRPRPGTPGRAPTILPDGHRADVYSAPCPSRAALDRIADKWTALLVGSLATGTKRFSELREEVGGISEKMLTQTLRSLERDGLVVRRVYPVVPPRVEYRLTTLGQTLDAPLAAVRDWAERYINEVEEARLRYDSDDSGD